MEADLKQMRDPLGLQRLGYADTLLPLAATRWESGQESERLEQIAEEVPVVLVYNGLPHVVMMATPADLEDFVLGFSLTEELIGSAADLLEVQVVRYSQGVEVQARVSASCEAGITSKTRRLSGRTGCGICGADSIGAVLKQLHPVPEGPVVPASAVQRALQDLVQHQTLNAAAGAVHAAGWADLSGKILLAREDVGRHNALDKLVGAATRAGIDPGSGFVVVTSRASFEMAQKATVLGASVMAAISGPTGLAVRVAEQAGLTLVGFVRGGRHTVYTHPHRIAGGR